MNYEYCPKSLGKKYENKSFMKKNYGKYISGGMTFFLNDIEAADNAYDLKCIPYYHMEHKKGNLKNYYSISLYNKKSKWRLLIQMLDENDKVLQPTNNEREFLRSIKKIRIKELTEHYGKY